MDKFYFPGINVWISQHYINVDCHSTVVGPLFDKSATLRQWWTTLSPDNCHRPVTIVNVLQVHHSRYKIIWECVVGFSQAFQVTRKNENGAAVEVVGRQVCRTTVKDLSRQSTDSVMAVLCNAGFLNSCDDSLARIWMTSIPNIFSKKSIFF